MLEKIHCRLILCLVAILWPSYGYGMDLDLQDDGQSSQFGKEQKLQKPSLKSSKIRSQKSTAQSSKSKRLNIPLSYKFLFLKYDYSEEYVKHMNLYGNDETFNPLACKAYTLMGYEVKPIEGPEVSDSSGVTKWKEDWKNRHAKYDLIHKHYLRALNKTDQVLKNKAIADFNLVLIDTFLRHGSEDVRNRIIKIEEEREKIIKNKIRMQTFYTTYMEAKRLFDDAMIQNPQNSDAREQFKKERKPFSKTLKEILEQEGSFNTRKKFRAIREGLEKKPDQEEVDNNLTNIDLYVLMNEEFKDNLREVELLLYSEKKRLKKSKKQSVQGFLLELDEIEGAIRTLTRLVKVSSEQNKILSDVSLCYNKDYLPETTSTWSSEQWKNWWTEEKILEVQQQIKKTMKKDYSCGAYHVRLMGNDPSEESLKSINPRELVLYSTDKVLFFKIKDQPKIEIKKTESKNEIKLKAVDWPALPELGPTIFEKVKQTFFFGGVKDMSISATEADLSLEEQWLLLDSASVCGYLPDDFSVEEMSRFKEDRKKRLDRLRWKGSKWELDGDEITWIKRSKKDDTAIQNIKKENIGGILKLDAFSMVWKPFVISNKTFKKVEDSLNCILKDTIHPLQRTHTEQTLSELKTLNSNTARYGDNITITYPLISPHKQKMDKVITQLKKGRQPIEYNAKDLELYCESLKERIPEKIETYTLLYLMLEKNLQERRDLELILDRPYRSVLSTYGRLHSWLPNMSYILPCRAFVPDVPYDGQQPIQKIDLSHQKLKDINFISQKYAVGGKEKVFMDNNAQFTPLFTAYKIINFSHNELQGFSLPTFATILEELDISKNFFETLNIVQTSPLPNLKVLNVSSNSITMLNSLTHLTSLTDLNLSHNAIASISSIGQSWCQGIPLRILDLSGNKHFPKIKEPLLRSLAQLTTLTSLKLVSCGLSGPWNKLFPISLDHLHTLDVRKNDNLEFPTSNGDLINMLPQLRTLNTDITTFNWDHNNRLK